ncbi:MAG: DUF3644 domain-containing protein [Planctomycetes bacterium]|nr:DUF3644 domain-containing protein [Planctomycetota bacterium]
MKKAEAALVAAIEIYNKPTFVYREESFAILCVNAWELLLKAKVVDDNSQDDRCLLEYEPKRKKDGTPSTTKKSVKKNRAGNPMTISIGKAMTKLGAALPADVRSNLHALVEIRDNSVHFVNPSFELRKRVLEIGTAAVKNFLALTRLWFRRDLSKLNLYLMPIGFLPTSSSAATVATDPDERQLLDFLNILVAGQGTDPSFNVALEVEIQLKRSASASAAKVQITNDPSAQKVFLSEEDTRRAFPWTYRELCDYLTKRYSDFKTNRTFHSVRSPLMGDHRFVLRRKLDPKNPRSAFQDFYKPDIVAEFDKHYTQKSTARPAAAASS